MNVLCLDLEGVLVPEVWQAVAQATGVEALMKTTRDIPVYDDLMTYRLGLLDEHGITLADIQNEIAKLEPLAGAREFLDWARGEFQVAIISDTFYEFADPLMVQLGRPLILCHRLAVDEGRVVGYHIRQEDPKRASVRAFKSLRYQVLAAGDSYNDISMLEEADRGFFFCAPATVLEEYPQYPLTSSYDELKAALVSAAATL